MKYTVRLSQSRPLFGPPTRPAPPPVPPGLYRMYPTIHILRRTRLFVGSYAGQKGRATLVYTIVYTTLMYDNPGDPGRM